MCNPQIVKYGVLTWVPFAVVRNGEPCGTDRVYPGELVRRIASRSHGEPHNDSWGIVLSAWRSDDGEIFSVSVLWSSSC